jgi:transposase-like protein
MNECPKCPKCNGEGYEYDVSNTGRILYRCKKCYWRYNSINNTRLRGSRLSDDQIKELEELILNKKWQVAQISRELNTTRRTVYRYKKLLSKRKEPPDET